MMKNRMKICLVVGVIALGGCMTSCGKEKTLKGFDIELAREVGKYLNVDVEFQEIVWEQKELELASKNIDVIWNGFTVTEDRKEALTFSMEYMENKQVVVGKKEEKRNITKDENYKIACENGSAGVDIFNDNEIFKKSTLIETTDQITALTEVLSGTSDFAIIDSVMANYYLSSKSSYEGKLEVLDSYQFESEYYAIGMRKGELGLAFKINEALKYCYDNSITQKIAKTYGLVDSLVSPKDLGEEDMEMDSFNYIINRKKLIIGYTVFAPIAFEEA